MAFKATDAKNLSEPGVLGRLWAFGLRADWNERIVTAVAASAAILLVATVAILMGMA